MRFVLILALLVCATSCDRRSARGGGGGGNVIFRPGTYASPDGQHNLVVTVTGNGIVNYSVTEAASGKAVAGGGGFSTYQRWFFYWDPHNRLWTDNSDMGPFAVHEKTSAGGWTTKEMNAESPLLTSIPPPVLDELSETRKRLLKLKPGAAAASQP